MDFVIQVDCPEDVDTYIHRVGRTARYNREGRGVIFLTPSEEEGMLERLAAKKVPVEMINVRQKKKQTIKSQLVHMNFKDPALKYLAQKAFITYVKSLYLQKDKEIFKLKEYDFEAYAASLGLPGAPKIKFLKSDDSKAKKDASRQALEVSDSDEDEEDKKKPKAVRTKYDRMFERQNQDVLADHYKKLVQDEDDEGASGSEDDFTGGQAAANGDDDDFLAVKRRIPAEPDKTADMSESDEEAAPAGGKVVHLPGASQPLVVDSNRREKLLKSKKKLLKLMDKGKKLVYDDEGNAHEIYELENEEDFKARGRPEEQRRKFLESAKEVVAQADVEDKAMAKAKRKEKMRKRKERERGTIGSDKSDGEEEDDNGGVELGEAEEDLLANFRADAESSEDEDAVSPPKKQKKWFQSDSEDEARGSKKRKKGKKVDRQVVEQPETLEDMEALAAGLLG